MRLARVRARRGWVTRTLAAGAMMAGLLVAACGSAPGGAGSLATSVDPPTAQTSPQTSVSTSSSPPTTAAAAGLPIPLADRAGVTQLEIVVEATKVHDRTAYTQGLLVEAGRLFESTGRYGESTLREVDPDSGRVLRMIDNTPDVFAEGLELVGDRLIQLTWREETAYVWDRDTFDLLDQFSYAGEGWGLCFDGERLVMSDGTSRLTFRRPDDFSVVGGVEVALEGRPVELLNELECVDGLVVANVWQTTQVVVIDPTDGRVVAVADAAELARTATAEFAGAEVLNGIAYDESSSRFLLTGKYWPLMFVVRFELAGS